MTFNDIFKSSFLNNVTAISITDMAIAMILAFGVGLFIFYVYKKTYAGVMYSSSFGVTLIALTLITTLVILAVTSNVVLSLGMVGALSIVRFRTAMNDVRFLKALCSYLGSKAAKNADNFSRNQSCSLSVRLAGFVLLTQQNGFYREMHTETAEYLGVTYRHLLYVISDFVKQGILRKTAQGYQILRPDQLRLLSTDRMS